MSNTLLEEGLPFQAFDRDRAISLVDVKRDILHVLRLLS